MTRIAVVCLLLIGGCTDGTSEPRDLGAAPDLGPPRCGDLECAPGNLCVPGCRGVCGCAEMPDSGVCEYGPCTCGGTLEGCALPPPGPYCAETLPPDCTIVDGGMVQCLCA
jgi:hypothetical protein